MPGKWGPFEPLDNEDDVATNLDLEFLKKEIGRHFPFYDVKAEPNAIIFFCRVNDETLETNFESLRISLKERRYVPMLRYEHGEHKIYVIQKPRRKEKSVWMNIVLFVATVVTTILTGSVLSIGFEDIWEVGNITQVFHVENLFNGAVFFAFPLLAILFIHEMGHYYISKRHGISTSLPFFIPIPPIIPGGLNIGTFGAIISSRDPMPTKKALFDIGIAGPLAGFLVALPVTIVGIMSSQIVLIEKLNPGELMLGSSLLFEFISRSILHVPYGYSVDLNPVAFAGWVGLLITSINLLPAGQLDGGHIARAVLGDKQRYASWIAVFIMIFTGWFFFAILILFVIGMVHPPPLNDLVDLGVKRKLLSIVALIILIICFIPFPIYSIPSS